MTVCNDEDFASQDYDGKWIHFQGRQICHHCFASLLKAENLLFLVLHTMLQPQSSLVLDKILGFTVYGHGGRPVQ